MLEIIRVDRNINFVRWFAPCGILSGIVVLLGIIGAFTHMNYGVDFAGGAEVQVRFKTPVSMNDLRTYLASTGLEGVGLQSIGDASQNEFLIKAQSEESQLNEVTQKMEAGLKSKYAAEGVEIRKIDIVGPKAGEALRLSGFLAMLWAIIFIMVYVGLRFDFKYAPGVVIALIHDSVIILAIYEVTGTPFTLQTVGAILAIIGYSVNDTVVIYDRIRENEHKYPELKLMDKINKATNETLPRTLITSGLTLISALSLLFLGGEAIRDFSLAMTVGIISGSYSTIYIATPMTIFFERWFARLAGRKAAI